MTNMIKSLISRWRGYKYRFLPWIAFNLKNRSIRAVPHASMDKLLPDAVVEKSLLTICTALENTNESRQDPAKAKPFAQEVQLGQFNSKTCEACESTRTNVLAHREMKQRAGLHHKSTMPLDTVVTHCGCILPLNLDSSRTPIDIMYHVLGFAIERKESRISGGGTGVIVTRGAIPKGCVLAMYPGTVYAPHEPILIQSIGNQFIFRCLDGILIDGNDRRISKTIYRSCSQRERIGPYMTSDLTWLTDELLNPLAIGQYINNHTKDIPANVDYQEFDVPHSFPLHLRRYLPNVYYSTEHQHSGEDYTFRRTAYMYSDQLLCIKNYAVHTQLCHRLLRRILLHHQLKSYKWPHVRSLPGVHFAVLLRTVVLVSVREISEGEELLSSYFTVVH